MGRGFEGCYCSQTGWKITGEALQQFCKDRLSSYKVPKTVDFVSSLPHTEVGKVNKVKVREMILDKAGQP